MDNELAEINAFVGSIPPFDLLAADKELIGKYAEGDCEVHCQKTIRINDATDICIPS
jgi:hypothetical protein